MTISIISVILAALRISGVTHPAFQATAHLFVGGLIVAGWHGWNRSTLTDGRTALAIALSFLETVVAVITRF